MREIKFRAWAAASQKMFYPDTGNGWELMSGKLEPLPNTILEQYTGLKDKNGKEIYEGDIVVTEQLKNLADCDTWHRSDLGAAYITITPESGVVFKTLNNDIWNWDDHEMITELKYIEIIGNIHTEATK